MSTQTLRESARQLAAAVLIDSVIIADVGAPQTVGIQVTRELMQYTAWEEQRRNYLLDPRVSSAQWGPSGGVSHSMVGNETLRLTRTSAAAAATYISRNQQLMPRGAFGEQWSFSIEMRASVPTDVILGVVSNAGSTAQYTQDVTIGVEWERYENDWTLAGGWNGTQIMSPRIGQVAANIPAGEWIEVRSPILEKSIITGDYFNGDSFDMELIRTRWLGAEDASASVFETRSLREPIPGLVQTTTLANAVESRVDNTYSVKVARGTDLNAGQAVRVVSCLAEPDLVGKVLLIEKISQNGLAMIRKAVASDFKVVNQEGKGGLS